MKGMFSQGKRTHWRNLFIGLGGLLSILPIHRAAHAEDVGAIAGEFNAAGGAASYTIPIQMPQGVAGMQPEVSLNYSSQGGNGLLGLGWSLGGLSMIHRCAATIVQDGVRGSVKLDQNDKFCMDGQRLIAIGAHGADSTEYRTEIDSFARIVSFGDNPTLGPDHWTVETKSGQTFELGNSADSKRRTAASVNVYWQVNKITDAVGNAITYSYHNQGDQHYPTRIDYAGNSIRIDYDPNPRPDPVTGYANGVKSVMQARVSRIASYQGETLIRSYTPAYDITPTTQQSRIASFTECVGNGNCLPETNFSYDGSTIAVLGFNNNKTNITSDFTQGEGNWNARDNLRMMADVDGDGLSDIVGFSAYGVEVRLSSGEAFTTLPHFGGLNRVWNNADHIRTLADVNGDGMADVVGFGQDRVTYALSQGDHFSSPTDWVVGLYTKNDGWQTDDHPRMLADFDGDGKADLLGFWADRVIVTLASGETFQDLYYYGSNDQWHESENRRLLADMNGDGLTDIVGITQNAVRVALSEGNRFAAPVNWLPGYNFHNTYTGLGLGFSGSIHLWEVLEMTDANGDGLADLVAFGLDGVYVSLSTGKGLLPPERWIDKYGAKSGEDYMINRESSETGQVIHGWHEYKTTRLLTDLNGDGRADIIGFAPKSVNIAETKGRIYASLSLGDKFSEPILWHDDFAYETIAGSSKAYFDDHPMMVADMNGDGLADAVGFDHHHVTVAYNPLPHAGHLTQIRDGNEIETDIEYQSIAGANTHYTKGTDADPETEVDLQFPLHVVTRVSTSNGLNGSNAVTYKYGGLKAHKQGRGLLGFAWTETENQQTGFKSRTTLSQVFPHIGTPLTSWTQSASGTILNESASSPTERLPNPHGSNVHFPYLAEITSSEYELNGALIKTETVTNELYDDYGNILNMTTKVTGGGLEFKTVNVNEYGNDPESQRLGRLSSSTVTKTTIDLQTNVSVSQTRSSAFEYHPVTKLLEKEIIEPDKPDLKQTTTSHYDDFGNKDIVTIDGAELPEPRVTETHYDPQGRYPEWTKNSLGHQEDYTYDPLCGKKATLIGPNGLPTTWTYDDFCRLSTETRADNTQTVINRYRLLDATRYSVRPSGMSPSVELYPLANVYYKIVTTVTGQAPVTVYYDQLGRELRKETVGFDNKVIYQDTEYDPLGRVARASRKYFVGDPIHWVNFQYDALDRVTLQDAPADYNARAQTRTAYNGLTTTITDPKNRVTTTTKDVAGQVIRVDQPGNAFVINRYDPYGNLLETEDAKGNIVVMQYDDRGRKTSMDDPDMGHWEYRYNAVGELIWQQDSKNQTVELVYDALGRMKERTESEGVTNWYYDTQPYGKGKLASVNAPGGYSQSVEYDELGRAKTATTTINGQSYSVTTDYDNAGRVKQVTRPGNFVVVNSYDANGYLLAKRSPASQVSDYDKQYLRDLQAQAADSAQNALAKAQQYAADAAYYQQWADTYRNEVAENANVQTLTAEVAGLQRHKAHLLYTHQHTGELYLESPERVMILHGEIDIPILIPPEAHYKVVPGTGVQWTLEAVDLATWSTSVRPNLVDSGEHVFFGDYNGDGTSDYIRSGQSVKNPLYDSALLERLAQTANEIEYVAETLWSLADNALARAEQLIAVAGQVEDRQRQAELWAENSDGQDLADMGDANSGVITYWQANTRDAEHRLTGFRQGNGLVTLRDYDPASGHLMGIQTGFDFGGNIRELEYHYDALDNVTRRHDRVQGVSESFQYDSLDRLKQNSVSGRLDGVDYSYSTDYEYDLTGNILYKSDVGHYSYGNANRSSGNAGPAALTGAGTEHTGYQYDNNGNLENGGGRVFQWTSFNKPRHLQKGTAWTEFTYGPDRARYLKTTNTGVSTVYIGKLYEEITEGTKTTHKHFIYAGGELAAIQIKTVDSGVTQPDKTRYLHTDALGSVDTITDGFGNIVERMGFDPFGMRRAGNWNQGLPLNLPALTNRGFTGHEHVDELGIIHMNGRIYDPELGRFLSADPNIQSPLNSQSHNRYSYVMNNPLKYTDPSGFFLKKLFKKVGQFIKKWGRTILSIAVMFIPGINVMVAGFLSGMISSGGDFRAGLKGALFLVISAGVAGQIGGADLSGFGSKFASELARDVFHGLSQGLLSEAFGGDFKSGFIGAFVGHSFGRMLKGNVPEFMNNPTGRTIVAAVVGGTAARAGGGKFANGAVSAAFVHLFNSEMSMERKAATDAYESLRKEINQRATDNPKGVINLSVDELKVIVDYIRYRTIGMPRYDVTSLKFDQQFAAYDTFLYTDEQLTGRLFNVGGMVTAEGGHINYLAVGMLAAHYGPNMQQSIPALVAAHNFRQIYDGYGWRNLGDIGPGTRWALFGAAQY